MTAQFTVNGRQGCQEKNVILESDGLTVTSKCQLWQAEYSFTETALEITLTCDEGVYNLPIVCSKKQKVTISDGGREINIDDKLTIRSSSPLNCNPSERILHQVGGLLYLPISVNIKGKVTVTVE